MLDVGNTDRQYAPLIPPDSFSQVRRTDEDQHRYFLGDAFEGVPFGPVRVGAQLTPPHRYVTADVEDLLPVQAPTFSATQSLALGGLASAWGAGVFPFSEDDLAGTPLRREDLIPHMERVADRIGVSGTHDDLARFYGECKAMLPPLEIDANADVMLRAYERRRSSLHARGFYLGRQRIAACSSRHRGRGPHAHGDMDFWSDVNRAVYRPRWTVEELQQHPKFRYVAGQLVTLFRETAGEVEVIARRVPGGERERHRARALVLAAGALGSARIALRSLDKYDIQVPIVSNPYTYVPVINTRAVGRPQRDRRYSLGQLAAFLVPLSGDTSRASLASVYSYRSLLSFKLLKEIALPYREGLQLLSVVVPWLNILGIHHPDYPSPQKYCVLRKGGPGEQDCLDIVYSISDEEHRGHARAEKRLLACFRRLGCIALRRIRPGHGSSIHYAGTLPMASERRPLTTAPNGRLAGTERVFVADGAVFPHLPAKGLTFTMMANADRVGHGLARTLAPRTDSPIPD